MHKATLLLLSCAPALAQPPPQDCSALPRDAFAPLTLFNSKGLALSVLPYGGTAQRLIVPLKTGPPIDVLLGFDSPEWYCSGGPTLQHPYFGALIGRVANRIAKCSFTLGSTVYHTPCNEHSAATGQNDTLHGGTVGYDRRVWSVTARSAASATLELVSLDGEEGFPSDLHLRVVYTVTEPPQGAGAGELGAWDLTWSITNAGALPTPAAPTQHAYFMLSGFRGGEETVLAHTLRLANASRYEEIDAGLIPTGRLIDVASQPWMDFTGPARAVGGDFPLPSGAAGYDNAWVFSGPPTARAFAPQAELQAPSVGLRMVTWTDAPSVQVYTGNFLSASGPTAVAKKRSQMSPGGSENYEQHSAITFETQR